MSHKAKAQKVDLATFYREQPEDDLPSAPDPNREPYDRNRRGGRGGGRDGGGGDRGDRNYGDRGDRERGYGDRGDRGGRGGRGFGDRNDAPPANEEDDAGPWQRAGPSGRATRDTRDTGRNDRGYGDRNNNNRYGDRDRDSGRNDRGFGGGYRSDPPSAPPAGERPKLILEPRTLPVSEKSNVESITNKVENLTTGDAPSTSSSSSASVDKFDRAFTKSRGNGEGSSGDFRKSGDRGSNYNDRGDRRGAFGGGRGFNDRGGDSRGFGGDRGDRRGGYNDRGGDDRGDRGDSRNFNDRRGGYNDRGGNNERRSNRYETDSEPIDDPRFAGKFGSSSRPGTDYDSRGPGTPNATSTTPTDISSIPTFAAPEKRDDAKANERKAAQEEKLQKAAAKAEAERKAKEEQQARKESELAAIERQKSDAANLVASGTKGAALVEIINNSEIKPAGAALVASILSSLPTVENITWTNPEEYGLALSTLLVGNDREQMLFIYELQKHCHKHNFPRIQTKSGQRSLIDILFQLLYKNDILESSGILKWWDDEEFDEIPGRSDALVQVTTFVNWLNEEEEADEEEEEDYEGLEPAPRNAA